MCAVSAVDAITSSDRSTGQPSNTIHCAKDRQEIHPPHDSAFLPHVKPDEASRYVGVINRLGQNGRLLKSMHALQEIYRNESPVPTSDRVWLQRHVWDISGWKAAPKGMRTDKPFQKSIQPMLTETKADVAEIMSCLEALNIPQEAREYFRSKLQKGVIESSDRVVKNVHWVLRASAWGAAVGAGTVASGLYPVLSGEKTAITLIVLACLKIGYTGGLAPFFGTARPWHALEFGLLRYLGYSSISAGLGMRLIQHPRMQFSHHTLWPVGVALISLTLQTLLFPRAAVKEAIQRRRGGDPAIRNQSIHPDAQKMLALLETYFEAKAEQAKVLGESDEAQGVSTWMKAALGRLTTALEEIANDMRRLIGEGATEDKDRLEKMTIAVGVMFLLVALPTVISAQMGVEVQRAKATGIDPSTAVERNLFLLIESACGVLPLSLLAWAIADNPRIDKARMLEYWFKTVMTFSLLKTIFVAAKWALGDRLDRLGSGSSAAYSQAAVLWVLAMTLEGTISNCMKAGMSGLATGVKYLSGSRARSDATAETDMTQEELEQLCLEHIKFFEEVNPGFVEQLRARTAASPAKAALSAQ